MRYTLIRVQITLLILNFMPDSKKIEKLNEILNWQAVKTREEKDWAEDVKAESLHIKYDYQLAEMEVSHEAKLPKVEKDLDRVIRFPDYRKYELEQQFSSLVFVDGLCEGKTLQQWVDEEYDSELLYYQWKVAKLEQSVERIKKERELRASGFVVTNKNDDKSFKDVKTVPQEKIRFLEGTTYYIDPTNGTDTFAGTRIDSTIDSTADTTHFVDDALTGADSYILNSYFFNVTRGLGSLISAFTAIDDTVTLATAITGMTAGDTYYILNAWLDLDQFTEVARSAGDKVIIRRGAVQCDDGTDLLFTSDGTIANPIIIEADFDNLWRDQVDLSATATATLTFGSKTVTYASDISGVLAAGDWIYASGDSNKEFAYEVASVVTTAVTLYLPYKGDQAGAGKTTYNMQDNPIWNTAAGDFQWNFDTDNYWKVQGLHIKGTDANGVVEIDSCVGHNFDDCIFEANSTLDIGINCLDDYFTVLIKKCYFFNTQNGVQTSFDTYGLINIKNSLLNGNSISSSGGLVSQNPSSGDFIISETEFQNFATADINRGNTEVGLLILRNVLLTSSTEIASSSTVGSDFIIGIEDKDGTVGDNRRHGPSGVFSDKNVAIFQSETTTVRSGGSNKSIKVTPTTNMTTIWDFNKLMLLELPIYATTASKQYDIYFRPNTTAEWTTDPTASELWIELEAWGHATNNFRKITKSTGVIDMNGSTAWQALSVTVAPAQAGVAYLRCWYAKTKEAGANVFFADPIPVIS